MGEIISQRSLERIGPLLWQNVAYGMPLEEVRGARPDAVLNDDPQTLHDGARSELVIPEFELASHSYSVQFYLKQGRLTQVTISSNGEPTIADFREVAAALRAKYGDELEYRESESSFSTAQWLAPTGVNVSLAFLAAIDCFNINFQLRLAETASKL